MMTSKTSAVVDTFLAAFLNEFDETLYFLCCCFCEDYYTEILIFGPMIAFFWSLLCQRLVSTVTRTFDARDYALQK